jgi:hypothetical protein
MARAHKSIARQARDMEAMNAIDVVEFPRGEIDPSENRTAGDGKFAGAFIGVRKLSRN